MSLVVTAERQYANGRCQVWLRCTCGCTTVRLSRMPIGARDTNVAMVTASFRCRQEVES